MARWHRLKGNTKLELPSQMIFVDTEAKIEQITPKQQKHTLDFGWACHLRLRRDRGKDYYHEEWLRFTEAEVFWEWVIAKARNKSKTWVFAHNWNYDAGILATGSVPAKLGLVCRDYVNDKPPFFLHFYGLGKTIILIDTINYFAGALKDIGQSIGFHKLAFPDSSATQEEWDTYCKTDVEIIKRLVLDFRSFIKAADLGNFQRTLASQAFTAYRHRFMHTPIMIHGNGDVCRLERQGYYGGRVECLYLGEAPQLLWSLDVNSMYPYIMAQYDFPSELRDPFHSASLHLLEQYLESQLMVARVLIQTDRPYYPYRLHQRLCFPVGTFWATLCTPELKLALKHGHILKVDWGARYKGAKLFGDYVDTLYTLRGEYTANNNTAFAYMCKIMLNSLYGKFGQNGNVWQTIGEWDADHSYLVIEQETPTSPIRKYRRRLGLKQEHIRSGETDNSFPAIAAHVTSYGRVMLLDLIEQAGDGHAYYCDTDSLMVDAVGLENLRADIDPKMLGALKVESAGKRVTLWGPKDYRVGDKEKHKGIRPTALKVGDSTWEQAKFTSWDYHLSQGQDGFITVETARKTLRRRYQKGTPTMSGWVSPFVLDAE